MRCLRRLAPWFLASACAACGSEQPAGPADASTDASDAATRDEPKPCTPKPRPSYVPEGWRPFDEYLPCSGLYVPTKPEELPPSPVWESCGADVDPPLAGCERIAVDPTCTGWTATDVSADANGNIFVLTGPIFTTYQTFLVADIGGKVYSAIMASDLTRFGLAQELLQSVYAPRWLLSVFDMPGSRVDGFVGGTIADIAPRIAWREDTGTSSEVIGPPGIMQMKNNAELELLDFNDPSKKLADIITASQDNGLSNSFTMFHGDSLFWFASSGRMAAQRRWDADTGPVDFINYTDPDHGAGDLGTDGKDMVWLESHGPASFDAEWATADYWTSPYVKDKKDLQPRRLRSEIPNMMDGDHMAVGCGRAAVTTGGPDRMRVLRLSDGASWTFPPSKKTGWDWVTPLLLTCDSLYARVAYLGQHVTIARFPFTSLGPAIPPD